ncbi:MAG: sensor histidine kinase [Acidobacteria bacterium]|nr:sensor histidine kinase [Acidobacteriota bacterium]MBI3470589.1 sensor histidine kinase [Candidatus Solibacter usitatus]
MASESSAERDRLAFYLTVTRAVMAAACLAFQLFLAPVGSHLVTAAMGVYALSSFFAVTKRFGFRGTWGRLTLCIDGVFFMVLASFGAPEAVWLAPLFYLYLLAAAVSMYGAREVALIAVACTLFFATNAHPGPQYVLRETILVASAFSVAYALQKSRLQKRVDELAERADQLRLAAETARESEQQRIAADFHDGPLQLMISFQMRLEILRKLFEKSREAGMEELAQLQEISRTLVRDLRTFVRTMRPLDVDGAGLSAATRRLVEEFQKESGIPITFVGGDRPFSAAPETCTDVLQMIREALNNVRKHAKATRVAVALEKVGKILEVSVDDNGVGFPFSGTYSLDELELLRMGPVSLKRRARSLGAEMLLESRPGRGAGLKLKIPI